MQKKLASKDDFNVTRDHFGSFPAGTVCNGPHVKGAPNPIPTRTAGKVKSNTCKILLELNLELYISLKEL